ncbi:MAG: YqiA/YcfP family alpha/beta fold hydrolase [Burkholderiaceae bacterium]
MGASNMQVIYVHGFRSSPASGKARTLATWLAAQHVAFACPALDIEPKRAMHTLLATVDHALLQGHAVRLVGSSLGGFYVSWIMERHPQRSDMRALVVNPAIHPARDLARHVGPVQGWHDDRPMVFESSFLPQLAQMQVGISQPTRYALLAATGDELIDWQDMVARYPGAHHHVVQGSDHALTDFASHWPALATWLLQ